MTTSIAIHTIGCSCSCGCCTGCCCLCCWCYCRCCCCCFAVSQVGEVTNRWSERKDPHFERLSKNLNLQSNSSLPKGQVISLVMHSGHSIRHAPEGPHSQNRPQSEVYLRDILTQKLTVFVHMKVSGAFISRAIRDSASIVEDSVGGVGARVVWTFCQPGGWRTDAAVRPNDESDNKEESDSSGNHKETALETADVVGYLSDRLNICTTKGHLYLLWRGRTRVDFRGRTHTSWDTRVSQLLLTFKSLFPDPNFTKSVIIRLLTCIVHTSWFP